MRFAIIYSTLSGNTQVVAQEIHKYLQPQYPDIELVDLMTLQPNDLASYSKVIIGGSTYGEGELNPFGEMFFTTASMESPDWSGTQFAIFGLGDSTYPIFCGAVDVMSAEIKKYHGTVVGKPLKIDSYKEEPTPQQLHTWLDSVLNELHLETPAKAE